MRLGLLLRYGGTSPLDIEPVLEAERLGFDSVWSGESYGTDAVTPTAWVLAHTTRIKAGTSIMQMPARTPACAAMTAMTLQALSGNRFLMGIGPSGPQVVEGWHGVAFGKPMERTREYIDVVRQVFARTAPLEHHGAHYRIPYDGPGATGLGKPLKSILHPDPGLRIYTASISEIGLRTAGEVADGVLPIWMIPERADVTLDPILEGIARAGRGKSLADFDIGCYVRVRMGGDLQACRDALKPEFALYIGGMGARSKNFYNAYAARLGFEDVARRVQDLFLAGQRKEAAAAIPDEWIDATCLVGSAERIRDRLAAWKEAARGNRIGSLLLGGASIEAMRVIAEAAL